MHFLLVQQGTAGDINPFLAVGMGLQERGHRVSYISHTHFGPLIRQRGLEFIDLEDEEEYRLLQSPDYWKPFKGLWPSAQFLTKAIRKQYELVIRHYVPGQTVAVASVNGFGVRIAHEKFGIPMVSAHVCPWLIRSRNSPSHSPLMNLVPYLHALDPTGLAKRIYFYIGDLLIVDPLFKPEINRLRCELGLPPVSRIFDEWMHSPQLIIGLFPNWYVNPYPDDWPSQTRLTQFPLEDKANGEELSNSLRQFLDAGSAPIVFSPGTGMAHIHGFFTGAIDACRRLKQRGLLLTRHRDQLPDKLPDFIHYEPYVPFSRVLRHASALISHGGIGSVSQGLRAGVPQLVMPVTFDQPDNARRLAEFGVARVVNWKRVDGREMANQLEYLLHSPAVRASCMQFRQRFPKENPVREACDLLEEFADRIRTNGAGKLCIKR